MRIPASAGVVLIGTTLGLALSFVLVESPPPPPGTSSPAVSAPETFVAPNLPPLSEIARPGASAMAQPITVAGLRVALPRLGIDLPLEIGDALRDVPRADYAGGTPENVALIFPTTRLPGQGGNTYIYAHARVGMFLALWGARVGDEVDIYRKDGTIKRVYRIGLVAPRVDPSDTHWLDADGEERLTLQTSTGPVPGNPRFIVVAYPEPSAGAGGHP